MEKISVLQLFWYYSVMHCINGVTKDDLFEKFEKLKGIEKYQDLLSSYNFINGHSIELDNDIKILVERNVANYNENDETLSFNNNKDEREKIKNYLKNLEEKDNEINSLMNSLMRDYRTINKTYVKR